MKKRVIIRKTFLSIMALLAVAITFTATTYAWFKINSSATVSGFDFQVTGGEGFLVSIDDTEGSYTNNLSSKKIMQSILLSYQRDFTEEQKSMGYYEYRDGEIVKVRNTYNDDGSVKDVIEIDSLDEQEMILEIKEKIQLLPRTSSNGTDLYDQWGSKASASDGTYLEFSVYFKAVSTTAEDNRAYDIYFNHETKVQDDGTEVLPTTITSAATDVELKAGMNIHGVNLQRGEHITVYTSNALRFSATDEATNKTIICEHSNDEEKGFGSYATDYSKSEWDNGNYNYYYKDSDPAVVSADEVLARENDYALLTEDEKTELDKLYNHKTQAMFTYYSNLKSSKSKLEPLKFEDRLRSYRDLSKAPAITTVETGGDAKLVTFRFWLEGWDADCIDGLSESVNVSLTFTSVKRFIEEGN